MRFREQARIAGRDARAAALAHLDFDDAERGERAQRVARRHPAHAIARREIHFGAEEVAGLELLFEQLVAHTAHDLRRQRVGAAGKGKTLRGRWRGVD